VHTPSLLRSLRRPSTFAYIAASTVLLAAQLAAQLPAQGTKKALTADDYARWRSIGGSSMSGDGQWVTYTLQFSNVPTAENRPVMHLLRLEGNQEITLPNASGATFSADSRWVAYQVEPQSGGRGGRGGRGAGAGAGPDSTTPPAGGGAGAGTGAQGRAGGGGAQQQRRMELRELATGRIRSWQDVQSFTFSPNSKYVLIRRRPAGGGGGAAAGGRGGAGGGAAPAAPAAPAGARGTDALLHDLTTHRELFLGSLGEVAFNKAGDLMAYTVDAAARDGNGLYILDLASGRPVAIDNDAKLYSRLTWTEDGIGLAALKGAEVERMRERDNVLIAFTNVRETLRDPGEAPVSLVTTAAGFPKGFVISERATLSWSDDRSRVFFGIKPQVAAPDTSRRRGTDEVPDVDIWNTSDERVQSLQMARAEQERNFTFRQAFHIPSTRFVALTDSGMRDIEISQDGRWGVGRDVRGYVHDYNRPAADFYRVNTATGERTLMLKGQLTGSHALGISPSGGTFLYWKDSRFQAYNLDSATTRPLGNGTSVSFVNTEFDHPGPKPSYGITGYTADGKSVIASHRYDLWVVPLDGSAPRNLTNGAGAKGEVRFRYVRLAEDSSEAGGAGGGGGGRGGGGGARGIDLTKPITLSAYGEYTKKAGFYELVDGELRELVYEDASFGTPTKAANADRLLYTRQTFTEFPDLYVSGARFAGPRKITNANPQHAEYRWGRRVLVDFKNKSGMRLQALLTLPDDYQTGEKRPMLVNFYEKNSQNLHRYTPPSYITGMGSIPVEALSRGYITLVPDIHFRTGSSHSDMLECVEAAVKKVIELGYADPKKIGINGHSYGGEGAAFIGTRSRLFAAVGVGAGVSDLTSDFSQNWGWSYGQAGGSGNNAFDYYLYGQGRWGFSPWDKPEVYRFESALTHAKDATAPFLIMHGTADPTVGFDEGLNLYNALRYNGKKAALLAYVGEGHGLRGLANRKDLTTRYFQFFDHYLKGAPAPKWLTDGVSYLDRESNRDPR
jgi:dipeptidyl aminopeptidase/acylaminoacyl peptidase